MSTVGQHAPQMRAGTPALPGGPLQIPRLEMRSSSSAEPAGRRGTRHMSTVGQHAPRMRAGTPALPGGPLQIPRLEMRSSSSAEPAGRRGAKHTSSVGQRAPRMRAGTPALPGGPLHIPRLEMRPASGAEPTGRRGAHVHHQPPYNAPQMRAGTPALPGDPSARGKDADQEIGVPRRALEGLRREDAGATLALPTWFAARAGNGGFSWRDWVPAGLATKTTGSMRSHPWCPCRSMLSMMGGAIC
jgi:hypothetical protein